MQQLLVALRSILVQVEPVAVVRKLVAELIVLAVVRKPVAELFALAVVHKLVVELIVPDLVVEERQVRHFQIRIVRRLEPQSVVGLQRLVQSRHFRLRIVRRLVLRFALV